MVRSCSFQAQLKEMDAAAKKLAPSLPAALKEITDHGAEVTADIAKFATDQPEIYKTVLAAIAEADKSGITPTVAVAKDPKACKYTEEGTMMHEMLQRVAASDRRMKAISQLEVTLTAAEKESLKAATLPKAEELGFAAADIVIPDKMKLSL